MARKPADSRRHEILQATLEQIQVRGLTGTRSADVADALGISVGLVHYHFGSLERLLAEAYELYYQRDLAELDEALSAPGTPHDRLRLVLLGYLPGADTRDWTLWLEAWIGALRDPRLAATLRAQDRRWRVAVEKVIAEGVASGSFRCRDARATAWRITSMLDGLGAQLVVRFTTRSARTLLTWFEEAVTTELGLDEPFRLRQGHRPQRR